MKIPGWLKITRGKPEQPLEHERLHELFGRRRGGRRIGCGVLVLGLIAGSQFMWTKGRQDYTIRAQVSEGVNLSYSVRSAIEEYFNNQSELPANNDEADLPMPGKINGNYVSQVSVKDGEIVVVYGNNAHENVAGKTLLFVPDASKGPEFSWTCSSLEIPDKWLSSRCRTTQ